MFLRREPLLVVCSLVVVVGWGPVQRDRSSGYCVITFRSIQK